MCSIPETDTEYKILEDRRWFCGERKSMSFIHWNGRVHKANQLIGLWIGSFIGPIYLLLSTLPCLVAPPYDFPPVQLKLSSGNKNLPSQGAYFCFPICLDSSNSFLAPPLQRSTLTVLKDGVMIVLSA